MNDIETKNNPEGEAETEMVVPVADTEIPEEHKEDLAPEEGATLETEVSETIEEESPKHTEIPLIKEPIPPGQNGMPTIPQLIVALSILVGVLGSPYLFKLTPQLLGGTAEESTEVIQEPLSQKAAEVDFFADLILEAESAYVWDVAEQRALFNKNAQAQLPLASLTKLMTAVVASEMYGDTTTVPIALRAIEQEGENGFHDGDRWNAKKLLEYTLVTSSNDGAYALASAAGALLDAEDTRTPEEAFIERMNTKAEEIGLSNTYFSNPTGLDASESESGSYGSARDVAFLMEYILANNPEILQDTTKTTEIFVDANGTTFTATNTNQFIGDIENALGSKTGYTTLAGGNLVIAFNVGLNHPIIISVLGSTRDGRFTDVEKIRERIEKIMTSTP